MTTDINNNQALIDVQIIDSHPIVLTALQRLIDLSIPYTICATSRTSAEALITAAACKPDIIILEPELDGENGLDLISLLIEKTKAKIIIYTGSRNSKLLDEAIVRGARGIIHKSEPIETLLKAIDKIHLGEMWLDRNTSSRILMQIAQANVPVELVDEQQKLKILTVKEEKVTRAMQMYPQNTLKQIAEKLHISEHTLRNHLASTYGKLGVRNRLELHVFCGKYQKTDNPNHHPKRRSSDY